jgi:hypothetical protein
VGRGANGQLDRGRLNEGDKAVSGPFSILHVALGKVDISDCACELTEVHNQVVRRQERRNPFHNDPVVIHIILKRVVLENKSEKSGTQKRTFE